MDIEIMEKKSKNEIDNLENKIKTIEYFKI